MMRKYHVRFVGGLTEKESHKTTSSAAYPFMRLPDPGTKHVLSEVEGRIFICSRYAGDVERNIRTAQALCLMAVEAGCAPFAPHLLYTQMLNDGEPEERELGISLGLRFMEACDEVWVYVGDGISDGMRREIDHARLLGKHIVEIREVRICARI